MQLDTSASAHVSQNIREDFSFNSHLLTFHLSQTPISILWFQQNSVTNMFVIFFSLQVFVTSLPR